MALSFVDHGGPDRTVAAGVESVIGQGVMAPTARVAGAALDVTIHAYLIVPFGSVTLHLRQGDPTTGTIMATLTQGVTAGVVVTGTGSYVPSGSAERMYLTGETTLGLTTIKMASMLFEGDEVPDPPDPEPDPSDVTLSSVELLAQDTLLLTFANEVINNADLRNAANYTITTTGSGIPSRVRQVMVSSDLTVTQVVLAFTKPTLGQTYTVTATGMQDVLGLVLDPTTKSFVSRLTKMDHVLRGLPAMYTKEPASALRNILQAFSRVDDVIGGNRSDTLP
jgi:hypothetical protein